MAWVFLSCEFMQARESLPEQLAVYVAKEKENDSIVLAAGSASAWIVSGKNMLLKYVL